jgi:nitrogen fixation NifU-like protein
MYNTVVLDHFQNPRNAGELPPPAVSVEVTNPVCGDILRLWLVIDGDRLTTVRFQAKGCVAAIAAASALTELAQGKTVAEAAKLRAAKIAAALGGLPPESGHAAVLAEDALKAALKQTLREAARRG